MNGPKRIHPMKFNIVFLVVIAFALASCSSKEPMPADNPLIKAQEKSLQGQVDSIENMLEQSTTRLAELQDSLEQLQDSWIRIRA